MDNIVDFILIFALSAGAHELAHVATAARLGIRPGRVRLGTLGLGLSVPMPGLLLAPRGKKLAVYSAGPAASLALALIGLALQINALFLVNTALFLFNLLPARTLDGGQILITLLARRMGFLRASRAMRVVSAATCTAIAALGVAQLILFPPNFTLLALSIVLYFQGVRCGVVESLAFTNALLSADFKHADGRALATKHLRFQHGTSPAEILCYLDGDSRAIIHMHSGCSITAITTEEELLRNLTQSSPPPTDTETQSP